jgi:hypothetical protein
MVDTTSFSGPTQVSNGLYVGDIQDTREGDTSKFDRVIGVCQDDCSENVSCDYEHFCLADGPHDIRGHNPGEYSYELLSSAIEEVIASRIKRETVLVHCHAGQSRSVTVATAALAVLDGIHWDEAYNQVNDARPIANPGPELVRDGKKFVHEHRSN